MVVVNSFVYIYEIVFQTLLHGRFRYFVWKAPYFIVWNGLAPRKPRKMRRRKKEIYDFGFYNGILLIKIFSEFRLLMAYIDFSLFLILR